jgi:hypothetical protein
VDASRYMNRISSIEHRILTKDYALAGVRRNVHQETASHRVNDCAVVPDLTMTDFLRVIISSMAGGKENDACRRELAVIVGIPL